jgi:hypothetical protein
VFRLTTVSFSRPLYHRLTVRCVYIYMFLIHHYVKFFWGRAKFLNRSLKRQSVKMLVFNAVRNIYIKTR